MNPMSLDEFPTYWYEGRCPRTGSWMRLPRTLRAETIARGLMHQLAGDERHEREGKMYGVLLVETPAGEQVLKAFSGLLHGQSEVAGWVPPIPGRDRLALPEAQTLSALTAIQQALLTWQQLPERQHYAEQTKVFAEQLQQLSHKHAQRKQDRQQQRQVLSQQLADQTLTEAAFTTAIAALEEQSRQDGLERRHLKRQRDAILLPLKLNVDRADAEIQALKQQRRDLSRQLQAQMHATYWLTNLAGESLPLQQLSTSGLPTGTGDCCAPKLLHYAASQGWKPLAMAEFWWGPPSPQGDKVPGTFYGACAERCQPLMGFLLSGLSPGSIPHASPHELALPICYEDDRLLVVNKPSGLLSVPGRYGDRQDSVLSRLRCTHSSQLMTVHRLDQDTSGLLLLAKDLETYHHLSQQFQLRQVEKSYEAVLAGVVIPPAGVIDLPLWGNPQQRPYQTVDRLRGKPSQTHFQVIARAETTTRLEFRPLTGRTHQIRVHAADSQGLGMPIVGDRLYGLASGDDRLHLHARELCFIHPHTGQRLCLKAETPF